MNPVALLNVVTVFCAGMLAGIEFVIHYGVRASAATLDDPAQLRLRQALILRLRVLAPSFFVPTALFGIIVAVLGGAGAGLWFRCAALLGVLIWAVIRVIGTVPINSATLSWQPDAPPRNWKALVDEAERYHIVGVWAAVLAFLCFLLPVALHLVAL